MEQQALLPGGDRARRRGQELRHVHPGGDRQRGGCDEQADQAGTPGCCRWWGREATKGRKKQRLRPWRQGNISLNIIIVTKSQMSQFFLLFALPTPKVVHPISIALTFIQIPFFFCAPSLFRFLDKVVWILCCLLIFF